VYRNGRSYAKNLTFVNTPTYVWGQVLTGVNTLDC
jgi:hypothetical protein